MKAKPTKGSARTRKFASGGDIAALAGLGTLAYLLSRKKDKGKDEGGLKASTDKPAILTSMAERTQSDAEKRALAQSKGQPELVPDGADTSVMESDRTAKAAPSLSKRTVATSKPVNKPVNKPVVKATESKQTPVTSKANEERPSKPFPEKEAAAKKAQAAKASKGTGPKFTFLTPERLDKSKEAMKRYREAQERKQRGVNEIQYDPMGNPMKKGGAVKKYAAGGSASKRADGIAQRGKTRGKVL